ncbi:hypothetical protein DPMN_106448 [Dreissena polymorpha]|uniref:Uncharacterized protein n=1 Tax=Dreissena polymorpha TaxID=45954 RepID=A0A9D4QK06_DREPO|nr:hypothetical protein DPMN_106448 [Dreissena polymorpha]
MRDLQLCGGNSLLLSQVSALHCGTPDSLLDDTDAYVADLYTKYSIVRPICVSCRHSGKEAKTWGAKKFVKKQKVK